MPYCQGFDLTRTPLVERKELLARVVRLAYPNNDDAIRYSDHIEGQGPRVLEHACRLAMEGVISKRKDIGYLQTRSPNWLKTKCLKRQEFVIGGYTQPTGSRVGFGALLLGYYDGGRLVYCGRVGTGFTNESLRQLKAEMSRRRTDLPPFDHPPTGADRRGVTWVQPELVGEVEFTEWTQEGLLRHPSFQGLREDKSPILVVREEPGVVAADNQSPNSEGTKRMKNSKKTRPPDEGVTIEGVAISHPDRVLYPDQGITKRDLAEYYESAAKHILPHIVGRPLTLVRCPQGQRGKCFYQKHLTESLPDGVRGVTVQEKGKRAQYVVVDDLAGLISLVQIGVLEIHPWPATAERLENPDRMIFDLDPGPGVKWSDVVAAARDVRNQLQKRELKSFARTSGGKGLHVVVPLQPRHSWDKVKEFAREIAAALASREPNRYVATMTKAKRKGKVFIDFFRNTRGATAIASYSSRARAGAPVAMPLRWDELGRTNSADQFTVVNTPRRLSAQKKDPWDGFFNLRQTL